MVFNLKITKRVSLTFLLILFGAYLVKSQLYDVMLQSTLDKTTPIVKVEEITFPSSAIFIDARTPEEFNVSHIENAIFYHYDEGDIYTLANNLSNKDQEIIVYCSVGVRSQAITKQLISLNYTNVRNLYGGIFSWVNNELPVVNNNNTATINIHPYSKAWGIWLKKGNKVYE